jgi:hypothetical protein
VIDETTIISMEDEGDTLGDESVEVLVRGLGDIQVSLADIVDGFIVDHELESAKFKETIPSSRRSRGWRGW